MLTFQQFIAEHKDTWGFLTPRKAILGGKHSLRDGHDQLAAKHGYQNAEDAVRKGGLVRYYHHSSDDENHRPLRDAGYQFKDTPENRDRVSRHLAHSGGFRRIFIDKHDPASGRLISAKIFNNAEAAQKHLNGQDNKA